MTQTATAPAPCWSPQQDAIFAWFEFPSQTLEHLIVRARAGTGKTTTIIEGISRAPEASILLCAFNKRIAEDAAGKLTNSRAQVKTLHAIGFSTVLRFWERIKVAQGSERADALTEHVCGPTAPDAIKRLVSKLHTKGREIAPHAKNLGDLTDIALTFECEPDDIWTSSGYDLAYVEMKALQAMELAATTKPVLTGIDFADMIYLPVRNHWLTKQYDLVVVDEAQDMTMAQLEIAQGVCRGRICVVGDDRQAIYGFRGADSGSLDRLKHELHASELGLTTTYRCGKAIVAAAQELVPDFQAGPENPRGSVEYLEEEKLVGAAGPGDFILSRVNAPLVSIAMKLLRSGKRTQVAGRDIGSGLKTLIRKFKGKSVPDLLGKIAAWEAKELVRLKARFNGKEIATARMDAIHDQAEMLTALADGAKNVDEVTTRIDALFTDDGLGAQGMITCSSVHKAKGLEANRVFILQDTLRDHNGEEKNIAYVAITRAKQTLVWVA
jgi:DNA helicase-2/ATP-dependent DNA helicase PcrA